MYQTFNKTLIVSCLFISLVGCETSGGNVNSKKKSFMTQGCIGGGVIGAIAGATFGNSNDVGGGAALGCAVGAYIGYRVAKRTDAYISAQQAIEAETARNQKNATGVKKNNERVALQIKQYNALIRQVNQATVTEKVKNEDKKRIKSHLNDTISKATADLNALNDELKATNKHYAKHNVAAKPAKKQDWRKKIVALEQEKKILSEHVTSLTALNKSI